MSRALALARLPTRLTWVLFAGWIFLAATAQSSAGDEGTAVPNARWAREVANLQALCENLVRNRSHSSDQIAQLPNGEGCAQLVRRVVAGIPAEAQLGGSREDDLLIDGCSALATAFLYGDRDLFFCSQRDPRMTRSTLNVHALFEQMLREGAPSSDLQDWYAAALTQFLKPAKNLTDARERLAAVAYQCKFVERHATVSSSRCLNWKGPGDCPDESFEEAHWSCVYAAGEAVLRGRSPKALCGTEWCARMPPSGAVDAVTAEFFAICL